MIFLSLAFLATFLPTAYSIKICQGCLTEDNRIVQCQFYKTLYFPSPSMESCVHSFVAAIEIQFFDNCIQLDSHRFELWFPSVKRLTWTTKCPCLQSKDQSVNLDDHRSYCKQGGTTTITPIVKPTTVTPIRKPTTVTPTTVSPSGKPVTTSKQPTTTGFSSSSSVPEPAVISTESASNTTDSNWVQDHLITAASTTGAYTILIAVCFLCWKCIKRICQSMRSPPIEPPSFEMDDMHTVTTHGGQINAGLNMYGARRMSDSSHYYSRIPCSDDMEPPTDSVSNASSQPSMVPVGQPSSSAFNVQPPSYGKATGGKIANRDQVLQMAVCLLTDNKFKSQMHRLQTFFPSENDGVSQSSVDSFDDVLARNMD